MKTQESGKGIAVYCASSTQIPAVYFEAARKLGALIAGRGIPVINGGGRMGLMAAVSDGALAAGGSAIGVIPGFMVEAGRNHPGLSRTIVTPDMHTRKSTMASMAVGVIALPGGIGTFEEVLEMMTWRKLGLFDGAVVILNINHYYDHLLEMLQTSIDEGFTSEQPVCWMVAETPEQALDIVINHAAESCTGGACRADA